MITDASSTQDLIATFSTARSLVDVAVTNGDQEVFMEVLLGTGRVGALTAADRNGRRILTMEAHPRLIRLVAERVGCTIEILDVRSRPLDGTK